MASSPEEDPSEASSGNESETYYNEVEVQHRINYHCRETRQENERLGKENEELKKDVEKLREEREKAIQERDEALADFTTLLEKVGSAEPEAYFTEKDLIFLASQRKTPDMEKIYTLENTLNERDATLMKSMLDNAVWREKARASAERIEELLESRKELMNTLMESEASNAKLLKENTQGKRKLEESLREVIRELNELKEASSSKAKRPRP